MADIRRVVRLTGGITNLTLASHSNALIVLESGVNQLTSSGADTFPTTIWNRSGSDADILGVTLPNDEIGMTLIDGANDIAEVSQTFSGVTSVTASLPMSSTGGTTPNLSIITNAANGVALFDALNRYPAADGSQITNVTPGPFQDTSVVVQDAIDQTKQIMFEAGNISAGQTRIITMDDADVDLGLVKEINREIQITANTTLTIAAHRNAYLPVTTAGITVTPPAVGAFYASGANFSAADITVGGVTIPTMQMFSIFCFGGTSIVKAST